MGPWLHFKMAFEHFVKFAKKSRVRFPPFPFGNGRKGDPCTQKKCSECFKIKGSPVRAFDVNKFIGCEILQAGIHYDKPRCCFLLWRTTDLIHWLKSNCFKATSISSFSWPLLLWLVFSKSSPFSLSLGIWGKYISHAINITNKYYLQ